MNAPRPLQREHVSAHRTALHLTAAGRLAAPVLVASVLGGWLLGGTSGLFGAILLAIAAVTAPIAWLHARGLAVGLPRHTASSIGHTFVTELSVRNRSTFFSAHGVSFVHGDRAELSTRPGGFAAYLLRASTARIPFAVRLVHRGRESHLAIVAHSTFPFGLIRFESFFDVPCDLLGLPRVGALSGIATPRGDAAQREVGRHSARAGEEELHGVRDWREGESLRRVHWRLSARRERLTAREFRPRALPEARVLVSASHTPYGLWLARDPAFEKSLSLAATLVEHHIRHGRTVRLGFTDEQVRWTAHRGRRGLRTALVRLADLEARVGDPWLEVKRALLSGERGRRRNAATTVVLAGRGVEANMPRGVRALDVDDAATDTWFRRVAARSAAR